MLFSTSKYHGEVYRSIMDFNKTPWVNSILIEVSNYQKPCLENITAIKYYQVLDSLTGDTKPEHHT